MTEHEPEPPFDERPLLSNEAVAALGTIQRDVGLTRLILAALVQDHGNRTVFIPNHAIGRAIDVDLLVQCTDDGVAVRATRRER